MDREEVQRADGVLGCLVICVFRVNIDSVTLALFHYCPQKGIATDPRNVRTIGLPYRTNYLTQVRTVAQAESRQMRSQKDIQSANEQHSMRQGKPLCGGWRRSGRKPDSSDSM